MEDISLWLKTSVLGIIILSALGGLITAGIIYFFVKFLPRKLGLRKIDKLSHNEVFERAFSKRQHNYLITYFSYHAVRSIVSCIIGFSLLIIAYINIYTADELFLTVSLLIWLSILLSISYFYFFLSVYHFSFVTEAYKKKLLPLLSESKKLL